MPTAAQIRTNHERAAKIAAKLSNMNQRVEAVCHEGEPAVLVVTSLAKGKIGWELARVQTSIGQAMGNPVTYRNRGNAANIGTMADRVNNALEERARKFEALQRVRRRAADVRKDLEQMHETIRRLEVELNL